MNCNEFYSKSIQRWFIFENVRHFYCIQRDQGEVIEKNTTLKKAPPCLNLVISRNPNIDLKSRSPSQTITTTKNTTPLIVVSKIRNERQINCQKLRKIKTDSLYFLWLHEEYLSYDIDFLYTLSSNLWLVITKRKL